MYSKSRFQPGTAQDHIIESESTFQMTADERCIEKRFEFHIFVSMAVHLTCIFFGALVQLGFGGFRAIEWSICVYGRRRVWVRRSSVSECR